MSLINSRKYFLGQSMEICTLGSQKWKFYLNPVAHSKQSKTEFLGGFPHKIDINTQKTLFLTVFDHLL